MQDDVMPLPLPLPLSRQPHLPYSTMPTGVTSSNMLNVSNGRSAMLSSCTTVISGLHIPMRLHEVSVALFCFPRNASTP
jgi:hypothetical protein